MKDKSLKKPKKRQLATDETEIGQESNEKPQKKVKKKSKDNETHGTETVSNGGKPLEGLNTSIFQYFTELTNNEAEKRFKAIAALMNALSKKKESAEHTKELSYTLKRLIRGCGASTNESRCGFYTALVAFLKTYGGNEVTLDVIFDTMQKELPTGATITGRDDADALLGKILIAGALITTGCMETANNEHLENLTNLLLQAASQRTYHTALAYTYLLDLLKTLKKATFESVVWPLLRKELIRPWPKQNIDTVRCLMALQRLFPDIMNAKLLKAHFGGTELLNPESFDHLYKIFWGHTNVQITMHPGFDEFAAYLGSCKHLSAFWTQTVDPALKTPTKVREIETLRIAIEVLNKLKVEVTDVSTLLSENFMRMLVERLKTLKQREQDVLQAFYNDFFEALVQCCSRLTNDKQRVAVIRRLILPPGTFNIEKYTNTRVVHQLFNTLGAEGVQEIYALYKSIFLATLPKNAQNADDHWLNFERLNAGYTLQQLLAHKSVQQAYKWRADELNFLVTAGVFYTDASLRVCKKEHAGAFSKEFAEQCKNMFYTSLQSKLHDLQQERDLLLNLVRHCDAQLQQKQPAKFLRLKQCDEELLLKVWQRMWQAVSGVETGKSKKKTAKSEDTLQLVFHIMLLHMGLQLLREPEMAAPVIEDLLKCMQRAREQKTQKQKARESEDEEPDWIEVLVDLFLHLLSANASALRNVVNALFPHFCGKLTLNAVHHILDMLNMKDGHMPLSAKGEVEDDDDEDENGEEEEKDNGEKQKKVLTNGKSYKAAESDSGEGSDVDSDDDDDDEEEEEDDDDEEEDDDEDESAEEDADEGTATDKLRNAISQALIESGAAGVGGAAAGEDDDDMASVDLNDMTEEEGRKLDAALAEAFKAMKKTSVNGTLSKKSKSQRVKRTTVMHFRIRVLDLIEIYLQHQPTLLIGIEIMLALYDMLEHCVDAELQPLQHKVEKVLGKLTSHKAYTVDPELNEQNLVDFVRLIVEKRTPALSYDVNNKLRNKCIVFLLNSVGKLPKSNGKLLALGAEYLQDFVRSRNPHVNITLISDIFKLRWLGVWPLAGALVRQGIDTQTRTFRRIQVYELLCVLYKNCELQRLDVAATRENFEQIEKHIITQLPKFAAASSGVEVRQSPKEFQTLLELLLQAQKAHARLSMTSGLNTPAVHEAVQKLRAQVRLDSAQLYQRYCAAYKLSPVAVSNGTANHKEHEEEDEKNTEEIEVTKKRKLKGKTVDALKQKKQKKLQRLADASKGLNGEVGFA